MTLSPLAVAVAIAFAACLVLLVVSSMGKGGRSKDSQSPAKRPLAGSTIELGVRELCFDEAWRFHRGDVIGAESPAFSDAEWRSVDLPHDFSIEDLPPRHEDGNTVLAARDGEWRFNSGDNLAWSAAEYDDRGWRKITLPSAWKEHADAVDGSGYGWYRRHITLPADQQGKDLTLDLSTIMGADETYFNGVLVGKTGSFPPNFEDYWSNTYQAQRTYAVPAELVRATDNVVAVRVYCPDARLAGMYDALAPVSRTGPFDPGASRGTLSTGHTVGGIGWYRKTFRTQPQHDGCCIALRLDGVYMDSSVWINGRLLGNHPYGYTSFVYDLTPHLNAAGMDNTIAVRVNNVGANSRWYSGSGIYRHTWLTVTAPVHIATWGVSVTTPEISRRKATVKVVTNVENALPDACDATVRVRLLSRDGTVAAQGESQVSLSPCRGRSEYGSGQAAQLLTVSNPELWSTATPALYRAEVQVECNDMVVDETSTAFGIRSVQIDAENGLRINGQPIKLRGACIHHDNGPLGSKAIDRAEERKVELLKAHGFNAIRCSHNPPSPALLDAADRIGMLVIDEAFDQWSVAKNPDDYHRFFNDWWQRDIESMVLRDRNHPCVIMWSIGNEIPEQSTAHGAAEAKMLADFVRRIDPSRHVTAAANQVTEKTDAFFAALDVAGYNYQPDRFAVDHARVPQRIMLTTESMPYHIAGYWHAVESMPWVIGDFVWTAWDYIGESGVGHANVDTDGHSYLRPWPWHLANCGDIDICGMTAGQSYYRDVVWGRRKLAMAVHAPVQPGRCEVLSPWGYPNETQCWTWPGHEGKRLLVSVFSRYPKVHLLLNGKEICEQDVSGENGGATQVFATPYPGLGVRLTSAFASSAYAAHQRPLTTTFAVPYQPGELKAIGIGDSGQEEVCVLTTRGAPVRLRLSADRSVIDASRDDLSYVTVEAVDADGNLAPHADTRVHFAVYGSAEIAGVGNSDPLDTDSFQASNRRLFGGRALAIIQPTSRSRPNEVVRLEATAEGLASASVVIRLR